LFSPKQSTFVCVCKAEDIAEGGPLMVTEVLAVIEQPLLSETVTVCKPALNAVAELVVWPLDQT
jgi:hypothetical protein